MLLVFYPVYFFHSLSIKKQLFFKVPFIKMAGLNGEILLTNCIYMDIFIEIEVRIFAFEV